MTPLLEEADHLKTLCVLDKLLRPLAVAGGKAQGAFSIHEVRSTGLHGHCLSMKFRVYVLFCIQIRNYIAK